MADVQKTPLSTTLTRFVQKTIANELDRLGKAIPATVKSVSGSIVTVNFEVSGLSIPEVKMPLAGSEYVRLPIQPGCKGYCLPADFSLGQMSGLGTGSASITRHANLSTLVFFPIGNVNFSSVDGNVLVQYGPNGVTLRDQNNNCSYELTTTQITETAQNSKTVTVGSNTITIDTSSITLSAGGHTLEVSSAGVSIDGQLFPLHTHSGVTTGTGVTGPVVP